MFTMMIHFKIQVKLNELTLFSNKLSVLLLSMVITYSLSNADYALLLNGFY